MATRIETARLTMAQAVVKFLAQQYVERDGVEQPFFAGVWGIFGHGNVAGIGQALEELKLEMAFHRPQNEQGMVHAAAAYAKMKNRLQTFACTSSIGPGATNMITGAAMATVNRLPVLLLPGDIFASRRPDPVLQQLEYPLSMDVSVNDAFIPVSRFWDRINRPEQILASLPEAMRVLTDQAETGAVTICLPQDVQAEGYDYPANFFEKRVHHISRVVPPLEELAARGRDDPQRREAADHRRRRGDLLRGDGRAVRLRRRPRHSGQRDPGREGRAALEPRLERGADRLRTAVWPPTAWRATRIWSSPSARACPTSPLPRTPSSRIRTCASSASTSRRAMPTSSARCRWSAMRGRRSTRCARSLAAGKYRTGAGYGDRVETLKAEWDAAVDGIRRRRGPGESDPGERDRHGQRRQRSARRRRLRRRRHAGRSAEALAAGRSQGVPPGVRLLHAWGTRSPVVWA